MDRYECLDYGAIKHSRKLRAKGGNFFKKELNKYNPENKGIWGYISAGQAVASGMWGNYAMNPSDPKSSAISTFFGSPISFGLLHKDVKKPAIPAPVPPPAPAPADQTTSQSDIDKTAQEQRLAAAKRKGFSSSVLSGYQGLTGNQSTGGGGQLLSGGN